MATEETKKASSGWFEIKRVGIMDYFVSRKELDEERDHIFNAISKLFSEHQRIYDKKMKDLESELRLLIDILYQREKEKD